MRSSLKRWTPSRGLSRGLGALLVMAWAGLAVAEPPSGPPGGPPTGRPSVCDSLTRELSGYKVPGRPLDSQMPWEFFLGNASHQLIAYIYSTRHPSDTIYRNKNNIKTILKDQALGNWSLLTKEEQALRPDITNIDTKEIFEIKPAGPEGLQDGTQQLQLYLLTLNRTLKPSEYFSAGQRFEGEILVQFSEGQYIWRLEWCTHTPGITQYLWTRTQQRLDSLEAAYLTGQWMELSEQELSQYGGRVARAVTGMVDRRERLATFSGAVGVAIDLLGEVAIVVLSNVNPDEHLSTQPMGKVIPFPSRAPSTTPLPQLPKASGL